MTLNQHSSVSCIDLAVLIIAKVYTERRRLQLQFSFKSQARNMTLNQSSPKLGYRGNLHYHLKFTQKTKLHLRFSCASTGYLLCAFQPAFFKYWGYDHYSCLKFTRKEKRDCSYKSAAQEYAPRPHVAHRRGL